MYFCNHIYLTGRLETDVNIVFKDKNERLATFTLLIPIADSKHFFKYRVAVENQSLVEYAASCLLEGKLVFVLGKFEPALEDSGPSWVVISKDFGILHPIGSHVHPPLPMSTLNKAT